MNKIETVEVVNGLVNVYYEEDENNKPIYIVIPFVPGRDDKVKLFSGREAADHYIKQFK